MELITFGKEVLQSLAEHAASYKVGQTVFRQVDRALWVIEKTARWAVPPPLDQDERPQPELIRPLPWVFFLMLIVVLRVTRESVSLIHLVMGQPPLRSADVVMYIQGKRRYLRTLKYQGNRLMRARTSAPRQTPWYHGVQSLFEFTMCFRRYTNNNSRMHDDNEQMLVIKRNNSRDVATSPVPTSSGTTMERLIEKMMVDLNADSDDDSSYTLTNANSTKTDTDTETEPDTVFGNDVPITTVNRRAHSTPEREFDTISQSPSPPKNNTVAPNETTQDTSLGTPEHDKTLTDATLTDTTYTKPGEDSPKNIVVTSTPKKTPSKAETNKSDSKRANNTSDVAKQMNQTNELKYDSLPKPEELKLTSNKEESLTFIQGEKCDAAKTQRASKKKFANGRVLSENSSNKIKGAFCQRRELGVPSMLAPPSLINNGSPEPIKENVRH